MTVENRSVDFKTNGLEDLHNSNSMKDILCQTWDYKEDVADAKDASPSNMDIVYRGYSFFSDGTVVKDPRGNIKTGKWTLNENAKPITINMNFDNGEKETKQLAYLVPFEMILSTGAAIENKTINLSSDGLRHTDLKDDPFYKNNISWRIKPQKPETDEEIKKRFRECIHFFVLFYDQKININAETVTFAGLPCCYTWYSGGITLQKEPELQKKWIECFYDKEQALKAYKLADKLISKKYDWPKKESNWLKLNVAVLKQMEKKIDSVF